MTEQEKIFSSLQHQIDLQNERINSINEKVDLKVSALMDKMDNFILEMRDRDNQRHAEILAAQEKHDADMKEIRNDIKSALRNIQGLTIASIVGIAAITAGALGFIYTTAVTILSR